MRFMRKTIRMAVFALAGISLAGAALLHPAPAAAKSASKQAKKPNIIWMMVDVEEQTDIAAKHPDVVAKFEAIMQTEHVPNPTWKPQLGVAGNK